MIILYTQNGKQNAEKLANLLKDVVGKVEMEEILGDPMPLKDRIESMRERKKKYQIDAAIISSAGSSTASAASKVFDAIIHITFPYGMWRNMTYPNVPRTYQKVIGYDVNFPKSMKNVAQNVKEEVKGIRGKVGEFVRKMNAHVNKRCYSGEDEVCPSVNVEIEMGLRIIERFLSTRTCEERDKGNLRYYECKFTTFKFAIENKDIMISSGDKKYENVLKSTKAMLNAMERIDNDLTYFDLDLKGFQSVLWTSGLLGVEVDGEMSKDKALLLDSSAIFLGLLNYRYMGYTIKVPRCAIYELIHKYAESVKKGRNKYNLPGLLAWVLEEEVSTLKLEHPSPPDFCDKAFFQLDALVLENSYVVTEDFGLKEAWKRAPLRKIAPLLYLKRRRDKLGGERGSDVTFYLFQLAAIFERINELLMNMEGSKVRLYVKIKVDDKSIHESKLSGQPD